MTKGELKVIIIIIVSIALVVAGFSLYNNYKLKENLVEDVTRIAREYGLRDVEINIGEKSEYSDHYQISITTSNFGDLSYEQMFELSGKMEDSPNVWTAMYFVSGRDKYKVYTDTIYKNSDVVYEIEEFEDTSVQSDGTFDYTIPVTDSSLQIDVWVCAQHIVSSDLKSPSTAKFAPITDVEVYSHGNNQYTALGYVDATNSIGATIRETFLVTLTLTENGYKDEFAVFF